MIGEVEPYQSIQGEYEGLCTTSLGPCIGIAAIGEDFKGNIIQCVAHLPDQNLDVNFFNELKLLMKKFTCLTFKAYILGGNANSEKFRNEILIGANEKGILIEDCVKNSRTDDNSYTDIFIVGNEIKFMQNDALVQQKNEVLGNPAQLRKRKAEDISEDSSDTPLQQDSKNLGLFDSKINPKSLESHPDNEKLKKMKFP